MRKKLFAPAYIAIITALLAMIGLSACKAHQTKYGAPPVDYTEPQPTKYGVPAPGN